jgi:hypothetical protein
MFSSTMTVSAVGEGAYTKLPGLGWGSNLDPDLGDGHRTLLAQGIATSVLPDTVTPEDLEDAEKNLPLSYHDIPWDEDLHTGAEAMVGPAGQINYEKKEDHQPYRVVLTDHKTGVIL